MFDVVIGAGTVVVGTEAPAYRADVGIAEDRAEVVGELSSSETRRYIDATGLTVSPGFIDTDTHSEGDLLVDPQHANGLHQGITTEQLGIDGMSYLPAHCHCKTIGFACPSARVPECPSARVLARTRGHAKLILRINRARYKDPRDCHLQAPTVSEHTSASDLSLPNQLKKPAQIGIINH